MEAMHELNGLQNTSLDSKFHLFAAADKQTEI
jgi:hypothetical protein